VAENLVESRAETGEGQVAPEQYQIFGLYVIKEWPAQKVAEACGVSVDQVYLAKHRVSAVVQNEIKRLETKLL